VWYKGVVYGYDEREKPDHRGRISLQDIQERDGFTGVLPSEIRDVNQETYEASLWFLEKELMKKS
jgi:hypothetical protein